MNHKITSEKSILRWDEAIPLGNGKTGCLIWGKGSRLRFSLDRTDIWDKRKPIHTEKPKYSYQSLIKMAGEKDIDGVQIQYFVQQVDEKFSYGIVMAVYETDEETSVFYEVLTSDDGEDWIETGIKKLTEQIKEGYKNQRISHREWWERFWAKSAVSLPDKFFEKQWYLTNYLFASCSRKGCYPMPLQGVWTADDGNLPPWKGDYHNDLNTQLSYTHFYKANHLEEGECFHDFLWSLKEKGREFARKFYHTGGICFFLYKSV